MQPFEFIPYMGYRLTSRGRSIILNALSVSKINTRLSDRELLSLGQATAEFLRNVGGRMDPLPYNRISITNLEPKALSEDVAYKFTTDEALPYWMSGSVRLNPPATYLTIENPHAIDLREGLGLLSVQAQQHDATITSMSGFNSLIICTSQDARKAERAYRSGKFGGRIVKISQASKFAARIAEHSGATDFIVRDVTYSDAKVVKAQSEFADAFVAKNGTGDLTEEALSYVAEHWIDELIRLTAAASIFTKPVSYRLERERRFQFIFASDVTTHRDVTDAGLEEFLDQIA